MNIHEYQGKEVFRKFGVPTRRGIPVFTADEAVKAAESLGGKVWAVKELALAAGREVLSEVVHGQRAIAASGRA